MPNRRITEESQRHEEDTDVLEETLCDEVDVDELAEILLAKLDEEPKSSENGMVSKGTSTSLSTTTAPGATMVNGPPSVPTKGLRQSQESRPSSLSSINKTLSSNTLATADSFLSDTSAPGATPVDGPSNVPTKGLRQSKESRPSSLSSITKNLSSNTLASVGSFLSDTSTPGATPVDGHPGVAVVPLRGLGKNRHRVVARNVEPSGAPPKVLEESSPQEMNPLRGLGKNRHRVVARNVEPSGVPPKVLEESSPQGMIPLRGIGKNLHRVVARNAAPSGGPPEDTEESPQDIIPLRGLGKNSHRIVARNAAPSGGCPQDPEESPQPVIDEVNSSVSSDLSSPEASEPPDAAPSGGLPEDPEEPPQRVLDQVTSSGSSVLSSSEASESSAPPNGSIPPPLTRSDSGLAVANLVEDETGLLPQAEEVDLEDLQRKDIKEQKETQCRWIGCVIVATCFIVVALTIGFTLGKKDDNSDNTGTQTSPTLSLEDYVRSLLPDYTILAMKDATSPQSKAFDWLVHDPNLDYYPEHRILQRYALATYYYDTSGDTWYVRKHWLDYERHECEWHTYSYKSFLGLRKVTGQKLAELYGMEQDELDHTFSLMDETYVNAGLELKNPCEEEDLESIVDGVYRHFWQMTNNVQGTLPPEMFLLTSLQTIFLFNPTNLAGNFTTELGRLTDLNLMYIIESNIGGSLPSQIGLLSNLNLFGSVFNEQTSTLPTELGLLSKLRYFYTGGNKFTGTVPSELGMLTHLEALAVFFNMHTGSLPTELGRLEEMLYASVTYNAFHGEIPSEIGMMTKLIGLHTMANSFSGSIPTEFGMMRDLKSLNLQRSYLTGKIPSEFGMLTALTALALAGNVFTNTIPAELGLMKALATLYLHKNKLTGPIPTELQVMTALRIMYLSENQLNGPIPTELGLLNSTDRLNLMGNHLSGSIPTELGMLTNARELVLDKNNLSGSLPSELGLLSHLQLLGAENNTLRSTIPDELAFLVSNDSLYRMNLANNFLSGIVPEISCSLGLYDPAMTLGLSFDCSDQLCGCCWCPCPGSNLSTSECYIHPDKEWPGTFPSSINAITINMRSDRNPEENTLEWSLYIGHDQWELLDTDSPNSDLVMNSYTKQVESGALYRLQVHDSMGNGLCCRCTGMCLGWFTIIDSAPSQYYPQGSVVWKADGYFESSFEVFLWVDASGNAHHVEQLPGQGYALVHDEAMMGEEPVIVVAEAP